MNDELRQFFSKPHASIPDAGRICFGLNKSASYEAAQRGDIPCIRLGGKILALTIPLRKIIGFEEV